MQILFIISELVPIVDIEDNDTQFTPLQGKMYTNEYNSHSFEVESASSKYSWIIKRNVSSHIEENEQIEISLGIDNSLVDKLNTPWFHRKLNNSSELTLDISLNDLLFQLFAFMKKRDINVVSQTILHIWNYKDGPSKVFTMLWKYMITNSYFMPRYVIIAIWIWLLPRHLYHSIFAQSILLAWIERIMACSVYEPIHNTELKNIQSMGVSNEDLSSHSRVISPSKLFQLVYNRMFKWTSSPDLVKTMSDSSLKTLIENCKKTSPLLSNLPIEYNCCFSLYILHTLWSQLSVELWNIKDVNIMHSKEWHLVEYAKQWDQWQVSTSTYEEDYIQFSSTLVSSEIKSFRLFYNVWVLRFFKMEKSEKFNHDSTIKRFSPFNFIPVFPKEIKPITVIPENRLSVKELEIWLSSKCMYKTYYWQKFSNWKKLASVDEFFHFYHFSDKDFYPEVRVFKQLFFTSNSSNQDIELFFEFMRSVQMNSAFTTKMWAWYVSITEHLKRKFICPSNIPKQKNQRRLLPTFLSHLNPIRQNEKVPEFKLKTFRSFKGPYSVNRNGINTIGPNIPDPSASVAKSTAIFSPITPKGMNTPSGNQKIDCMFKKVFTPAPSPSPPSTPGFTKPCGIFTKTISKPCTVPQRSTSPTLGKTTAPAPTNEVKQTIFYTENALKVPMNCHSFLNNREWSQFYSQQQWNVFEAFKMSVFQPWFHAMMRDATTEQFHITQYQYILNLHKTMGISIPAAYASSELLSEAFKMTINQNKESYIMDTLQSSEKLLDIVQSIFNCPDMPFYNHSFGMFLMTELYTEWLGEKSNKGCVEMTTFIEWPFIPIPSKMNQHETHFDQLITHKLYHIQSSSDEVDILSKYSWKSKTLKNDSLFKIISPCFKTTNRSLLNQIKSLSIQTKYVFKENINRICSKKFSLIHYLSSLESNSAEYKDSKCMLFQWTTLSEICDLEHLNHVIDMWDSCLSMDEMNKDEIVSWLKDNIDNYFQLVCFEQSDDEEEEKTLLKYNEIDLESKSHHPQQNGLKSINSSIVIKPDVTKPVTSMIQKPIPSPSSPKVSSPSTTAVPIRAHSNVKIMETKNSVPGPFSGSPRPQTSVKVKLSSPPTNSLVSSPNASSSQSNVNEKPTVTFKTKDVMKTNDLNSWISQQNIRPLKSSWSKNECTMHPYGKVHIYNTVNEIMSLWLDVSLSETTENLSMVIDHMFFTSFEFLYRIILQCIFCEFTKSHVEKMADWPKLMPENHKNAIKPVRCVYSHPHWRQNPYILAIITILVKYRWFVCLPEQSENENETIISLYVHPCIDVHGIYTMYKTLLSSLFNHNKIIDKTLQSILNNENYSTDSIHIRFLDDFKHIHAFATHGGQLEQLAYSIEYLIQSFRSSLYSSMENESKKESSRDFDDVEDMDEHSDDQSLLKCLSKVTEFYNIEKVSCLSPNVIQYLEWICFIIYHQDYVCVTHTNSFIKETQWRKNTPWSILVKWIDFLSLYRMSCFHTFYPYSGYSSLKFIMPILKEESLVIQRSNSNSFSDSQDSSSVSSSESIIQLKYLEEQTLHYNCRFDNDPYKMDIDSTYSIPSVLLTGMIDCDKYWNSIEGIYYNLSEPLKRIDHIKAKQNNIPSRLSMTSLMSLWDNIHSIHMTDTIGRVPKEKWTNMIISYLKLRNSNEPLLSKTWWFQSIKAKKYESMVKFILLYEANEEVSKLMFSSSLKQDQNAYEKLKSLSENEFETQHPYWWPNVQPEATKWVWDITNKEQSKAYKGCLKLEVTHLHQLSSLISMYAMMNYRRKVHISRSGRLDLIQTLSPILIVEYCYNILNNWMIMMTENPVNIPLSIYVHLSGQDAFVKHRGETKFRKTVYMFDKQMEDNALTLHEVNTYDIVLVSFEALSSELVYSILNHHGPNENISRMEQKCTSVFYNKNEVVNWESRSIWQKLIWSCIVLSPSIIQSYNSKIDYDPFFKNGLRLIERKKLWLVGTVEQSNYINKLIQNPLFKHSFEWPFSSHPFKYSLDSKFEEYHVNRITRLKSNSKSLVKSISNYIFNKSHTPQVSIASSNIFSSENSSFQKKFIENAIECMSHSSIYTRPLCYSKMNEFINSTVIKEDSRLVTQNLIENDSLSMDIESLYRHIFYVRTLLYFNMLDWVKMAKEKYKELESEFKSECKELMSEYTRLEKSINKFENGKNKKKGSGGGDSDMDEDLEAYDDMELVRPPSYDSGDDSDDDKSSNQMGNEPIFNQVTGQYENLFDIEADDSVEEEESKTSTKKKGKRKRKENPLLALNAFNKKKKKEPKPKRPELVQTQDTIKNARKQLTHYSEKIESLPDNQPCEIEIERLNMEYQEGFVINHLKGFLTKITSFNISDVSSIFREMEVKVKHQTDEDIEDEFVNNSEMIQFDIPSWMDVNYIGATPKISQKHLAIWYNTMLRPDEDMKGVNGSYKENGFYKYFDKYIRPKHEEQMAPDSASSRDIKGCNWLTWIPGKRFVHQFSNNLFSKEANIRKNQKYKALYVNKDIKPIGFIQMVKEHAVIENNPEWYEDPSGYWKPLTLYIFSSNDSMNDFLNNFKNMTIEEKWNIQLIGTKIFCSFMEEDKICYEIHEFKSFTETVKKSVSKETYFTMWQLKNKGQLFIMLCSGTWKDIIEEIQIPIWISDLDQKENTELMETALLLDNKVNWFCIEK
jgi:hypothetical protein